MPDHAKRAAKAEQKAAKERTKAAKAEARAARERRRNAERDTGWIAPKSGGYSFGSAEDDDEQPTPPTGPGGVGNLPPA